jgi:hypothetical protein
MSRQLAVINPQFGDLSPTDDSRRSVQRALGKADRRLLTDAIQQFAACVDPNGEASTRPAMAYRNMTAMVYRPAGLNALQRKAKAAGENARDAMRESELEFLRVPDRRHRPGGARGRLLLRSASPVSQRDLSGSRGADPRQADHLR